MASAYRIEGCTVDDAAALARNNASAFWHQPYWRLGWQADLQLDFMIAQFAKRLPARLVADRDVLRHQKAVDPATGAVLGYARWILPPAAVRDKEQVPWLEAQVPDVDDAQRKEFEQLSASAWWKAQGQIDTGALDERIAQVKRRISAEKPYIKLDYLAVHPDHQRKGVASALVESGIRAAHQLGLPIFCIAFQVSRGLYLRLGFREVDRVIEYGPQFGDTGEYGGYFLVYEGSEKAE
ncbi:hypothetical protein VTK73DRAFT_9222 [Phialemonium thermophilum]|uniref:N-acetyltransferase domain-containing protein n=1 Tax=Phialemonium thermophilum TaxID=223376 RepID=A0ABR3W3I6_9PEZI